jgi:competence protein ComEC
MRRLLAALTLCLTLLCPVALPVPPQPSTQTQPDPKAQTVYVTRTGKKYHRDGCRYLAASKSPMSLKDAKAKGYTA